MKSLLLVLLVCISISVARAQDGAIPIRIPDGPQSRCINGGTDRIWLTMRRVVTDKNSSWLTEDKSISVIATVLVHSDPDAAKPLSFPLTTQATVGPYQKGQVSVPIEYSLVDGFNLAQANVKYTGFQMDFTLLNMRGRTKWGSGLDALDQVAKKLPLPASPITSSSTYLLDFANTAVKNDLNAQDTSDKVKAATITLDFDPTGACSSQAFERTGTIAVIQGGKPKGDFFVDIGHINDYCWAADLRPAFILKAASKDAVKACTDASYAPQWKQVSNNYVAFFLNAVGTTGKAGGPPSNDEKVAIARCKAHGIGADACLK